MRFWNRKPRPASSLKAERPEARPDLVDSIASEICHARPGYRLRATVAATATCLVLATMSMFGGVGYAWAGLSAVKSTVSHVVSAPPHVAHHTGPTAADGQYCYDGDHDGDCDQHHHHHHHHHHPRRHDHPRRHHHRS
jgi:hypothetical protein